MRKVRRKTQRLRLLVGAFGRRIRYNSLRRNREIYNEINEYMASGVGDWKGACTPERLEPAGTDRRHIGHVDRWHAGLTNCAELIEELN